MLNQRPLWETLIGEGNLMLNQRPLWETLIGEGNLMLNQRPLWKTLIGENVESASPLGDADWGRRCLKQRLFWESLLNFEF